MIGNLRGISAHRVLLMAHYLSIVSTHGLLRKNQLVLNAEKGTGWCHDLDFEISRYLLTTQSSSFIFISISALYTSGEMGSLHYLRPT